MQHQVTSFACVPLVWDDDAGTWLVDPAEADRGQLEGPELPDHCRTDDCQCIDKDECEAAADRALLGDFPTAVDLADMLAHALRRTQ